MASVPLMKKSKSSKRGTKSYGDNINNSFRENNSFRINSDRKARTYEPETNNSFRINSNRQTKSYESNINTTNNSFRRAQSYEPNINTKNNSFRSNRRTKSYQEQLINNSFRINSNGRQTKSYSVRDQLTDIYNELRKCKYLIDNPVSGLDLIGYNIDDIINIYKNCFKGLLFLNERDYSFKELGSGDIVLGSLYGAGLLLSLDNIKESDEDSKRKDIFYLNLAFTRFLNIYIEEPDKIVFVEDPNYDYFMQKRAQQIFDAITEYTEPTQEVLAFSHFLINGLNSDRDQILTAEQLSEKIYIFNNKLVFFDENEFKDEEDEPVENVSEINKFISSSENDILERNTPKSFVNTETIIVIDYLQKLFDNYFYQPDKLAREMFMAFNIFYKLISNENFLVEDEIFENHYQRAIECANRWISEEMNVDVLKELGNDVYNDKAFNEASYIEDLRFVTDRVWKDFQSFKMYGEMDFSVIYSEMRCSGDRESCTPLDKEITIRELMSEDYDYSKIERYERDNLEMGPETYSVYLRRQREDRDRYATGEAIGPATLSAYMRAHPSYDNSIARRADRDRYARPGERSIFGPATASAYRRKEEARIDSFVRKNRELLDEEDRKRESYKTPETKYEDWYRASFMAKLAADQQDNFTEENEKIKLREVDELLNSIERREEILRQRSYSLKKASAVMPDFFDTDFSEKTNFSHFANAAMDYDDWFNEEKLADIVKREEEAKEASYQRRLLESIEERRRQASLLYDEMHPDEIPSWTNYDLFSDSFTNKEVFSAFKSPPKWWLSDNSYLQKNKDNVPLRSLKSLDELNPFLFSEDENEALDYAYNQINRQNLISRSLNGTPSVSSFFASTSGDYFEHKDSAKAEKRELRSFFRRQASLASSSAVIDLFTSYQSMKRAGDTPSVRMSFMDSEDYFDNIQTKAKTLNIPENNLGNLDFLFNVADSLTRLNDSYEREEREIREYENFFEVPKGYQYENFKSVSKPQSVEKSVYFTPEYFREEDENNNFFQFLFGSLSKQSFKSDTYLNQSVVLENFGQLGDYLGQAAAQTA